MGLGYSFPLKANGVPNYDLALTTLMAQFYPSGLLGVGLTGLMASFMSGMAGNVTAFNTVWTYDIYQSYIRKSAPDSHYLWMGRMSTIFGVLMSIGAAYLATLYNNIMDLLQLVFGFVNAPLLATFLLGMFWKRSTGHGAFSGLAAGTTAAALTHGLTVAEGKGAWLGNLYEFPSTMAQNFWIALLAFTACLVVSTVVSLLTQPRPAGELKGLVYGLTALPPDEGVVWYRKPWVIAVIAGVACILLNFLFW
jgi:SSS family solute:Na+ symporter